MTIDVSEEPDPADWAPLPTTDRALVGGRTVWTGPFQVPVLVSQPNRWGVVEASLPDAPCLVEADPPVTPHLPLPAEVVGFVDRLHRPIPAPVKSDTGRRLMTAAASLAKSLTQIRGVKVAASPFARTVPLVTPRSPDEVIARCEDEGVVGIRPLPGLAGGIALSVRAEHGRAELDRLVAVIRGSLGG